MSYQVDFRSLEDIWGSLEIGQKELRVKLLNVDDKSWTYANAIVSRREFPEGEKIKVFGRFGLEAGEIYIKILNLEELI